MGTAIDLEALLVALVLSPATYSRNRFFDLYADPDVRRVRRRASVVRGIVRHVAGADPARRGEVVETAAAASGRIALTYVVPALGLRRTAELDEGELSLVRYAIARVAAGRLPQDDADRLRIEAALLRLSPAPLPPLDS